VLPTFLHTVLFIVIIIFLMLLFLPFLHLKIYDNLHFITYDKLKINLGETYDKLSIFPKKL